jgi:D-glycero-D-manno-heptose 1,7-bisphosphate phosphatase
MTATSKIVLLDRDGVLNVANPTGYILDVGDLELLPGAADAVARLNRAGYTVVVISNQQAVGKGQLSMDDLDCITDALGSWLERFGGHIEDFLYCTHRSAEHCDCRKPKPGLIFEAAARYGFDIKATYFIGDNYNDLATAGNAGCKAIFISSGVDSERASQGYPFPYEPEYVAWDLAEAVDWLLAHESTPSA